MIFRKVANLFRLVGTTSGGQLNLSRYVFLESGRVLEKKVDQFFFFKESIEVVDYVLHERLAATELGQDAALGNVGHHGAVGGRNAHLAGQAGTLGQVDFALVRNGRTLGRVAPDAARSDLGQGRTLGRVGASLGTRMETKICQEKAIRCRFSPKKKQNKKRTSPASPGHLLALAMAGHLAKSAVQRAARSTEKRIGHLAWSTRKSFQLFQFKRCFQLGEQTWPIRCEHLPNCLRRPHLAALTIKGHEAAEALACKQRNNSSSVLGFFFSAISWFVPCRPDRDTWRSRRDTFRPWADTGRSWTTWDKWRLWSAPDT